MRYAAQEIVTIKAGTTGNKKYVANWESEEKYGIKNSNAIKFIDAILSVNPNVSYVKFKSDRKSTISGYSAAYVIGFDHLNSNIDFAAKYDITEPDINKIIPTNIAIKGVYECDNSNNVISKNLLNYTSRNSFSSNASTGSGNLAFSRDSLVECLSGDGRLYTSISLNKKISSNYVKIVYANYIPADLNSKYSIAVYQKNDSFAGVIRYNVLQSEIIGNDMEQIVRIY